MSDERFTRSVPCLVLGLTMFGCAPAASDCPDPPAPVPEAEPPSAATQPECPPQEPAKVVRVPEGETINFIATLAGTKKDGLAGISGAVELFEQWDWSSFESTPVARRDALVLLVDHLEHLTDMVPFGVVQAHLTIVEGDLEQAPERWQQAHQQWLDLGYRIGYVYGEGHGYEPDLHRMRRQLDPGLSPSERAWLEAVAAWSIAADHIRAHRGPREGVPGWFGEHEDLFDAVLAAEAAAAIEDPVWANEFERSRCVVQRQLISGCTWQLMGPLLCDLDAAGRTELETFTKEHPDLATSTVIGKFLESAAKKGDTLTRGERTEMADELVGPCPEHEEPAEDFVSF